MTNKTNERFVFLNLLRESGATNMFGAAPYLEGAFGISRAEARKTLSEWMRWVEQDPRNREVRA